MATKILKKDGTEEPFSSEKIMASISAAADETDLSDEMKNQIVEEVSSHVIKMAESKEKISTEEIRNAILEKLDKDEPKVADAWRKFEDGK